MDDKACFWVVMSRWKIHKNRDYCGIIGSNQIGEEVQSSSFLKNKTFCVEIFPIILGSLKIFLDLRKKKIVTSDAIGQVNALYIELPIFFYLLAFLLFIFITFNGWMREKIKFIIISSCIMIYGWKDSIRLK